MLPGYPAGDVAMLPRYPTTHGPITTIPAGTETRAERVPETFAEATAPLKAVNHVDRCVIILRSSTWDTSTRAIGSAKQR